MKKLVMMLLLPLMALADKEIVNGIEWNYTVKDGKAKIFSVDSVTTETMRIPSTLGEHPVISVSDLAFRNGRTRYVIVPASVEEFCFGARRLVPPNKKPPKGCEVVSFVVDEANLWYSSTNGLVCTKDGKNLVLGVNGDVVIPSCVTNIGRFAFYKRDGLRSVSIPNSVQHIEPCAFSGCRKLASVKIPNGVKKIEDGVFSDCKALTSVSIPPNVISVGPGAFSRTPFYDNLPNDLVILGDGLLYKYKGKGLSPVVIPSNATRIGDSAFSRGRGLLGGSRITSVTIPSSVTRIGANAFFCCFELTNVIIHAGVKRIDDMAFGSCIRLKSVEIPPSVESIGNGVFSGCRGLEKISIPSSVTNIGAHAFSACTNLTSIVLSPRLTDIEQGTFLGCSALTSLIIPPGVTNIGIWAFSSCSNLVAVTLPSSVQNLKGAFTGCNRVISFTVDAKNEMYSSINGMLCTKDGQTIIHGVNTDVTMPMGIKRIGSGAFYGRRNVTSVTIPKSVIEIEKNAFARCDGLSVFTLPSTLTNIDTRAFSECPNLRAVTVINDDRADVMPMADFLRQFEKETSVRIRRERHRMEQMKKAEAGRKSVELQKLKECLRRAREDRQQ